VEERTRQLKELAERDPLTGLPNRRELFTLLNAAIERARLKGCHVGVLFLDIDNSSTSMTAWGTRSATGYW
jgi:diguanylate cyclase (GGDEF)-like protein